jgi:expansin (peptidoglycan-binding protein)
LYRYLKPGYIGALLLTALSLFVLSGQPQAAQQPLTFLPMLRTAGTAQNPLHTGEGTFYGATGAGNCSFDPSPQDLMVAAMNAIDYANSAICGAFVEITGPKGTVTVRIVDKCPECPVGNVDLSAQAFERIADPIAGRVPISWRIVSPEISGPIRYRFKEGSSQWWTGIQIRNHRNPIAKVEYRNAAGQFITVPRLDYNYFIQEGGMGVGPYTFRVTDMYGNVLMDTIALQEGVDIAGAGQFPKGP